MLVWLMDVLYASFELDLGLIVFIYFLFFFVSIFKISHEKLTSSKS